MYTAYGGDAAGIKQRRRDLSSDGIRNLVMASGRGRLKRGSRIIYVATASGLQRRSKRAKVTKDFGPDYMTYIVNEEPQTYKAAMESSEAPYWKEAIQSEIDSIMHNNTWKLVDLLSGHKPIGHKWIFKKKLRPDGTIEKYTARLVAKGYRQKEGQDFFNTYSARFARITSIRNTGML
ncbi:DNA polymerase zeta catalytic subunit-like protein [Tanacetum coccineum]|uniref:DNA polymerase zeta catalytic subunit-like protein n=1 Tax=Tanacetum coccineum TaxID=301880 RepID=A0ABQ5CEF8_9ASTR